MILMLVSLGSLFIDWQVDLRVAREDTANHVVSNPCSCADAHDNYIVKLHKPFHHFDSNHWFHSMF